MSDDDDSAPAEPAGPPAPKPNKIMLGLLAANLAISAFMLVKTIGAKPAHAAPEHAQPEATHREITGPLVALEPFVVNLDEPGSPRYLKVQIQAEVREEKDAKAFEKNKTIIHDEVLGYLSGLKVSETLGAENKDHIRTELAARMGKVIGDDRVRRIVFGEFVVQ
jgi:flagellar FliL protein